jgi:hypothetical protein
MNDDIPFDKNLELAPDVVDEPMPGVRRIMAISARCSMP